MSDGRQSNPAFQRSLSLRIEKAIYGGAGLARHDGKAIFTPYTLPGELVAAVVTNDKASFAEAVVANVMEASPARVRPACPYFGICGGCQYQHASYPAQLAMKAAILKETLTRSRLTDLPEIVTHAGEPFGYRTRIRLHVDPVTSSLAYRERGAHRLIDVKECPIATPELERALAALTEDMVKQQCGGCFSQVELSANHDASELLLAFWLRAHANLKEAGSRLAQLCDALQKRLPELRGGGVHAADADARAGAREVPRYGGRLPKYGSGLPRREKRTWADRARDQDTQIENPPGAMPATWGVTQMTYRVAALDYRVSLGAFFQVNRMLVDELVGLATQARGGRLAWDLYAGVGLFSCALAAHFGQVVAVEGAPISYEDLRVNLCRPHQAVCSGTVEFLRRQAAAPRSGATAAEPPDFVLVDPPRAGLGEEVTRLLAQIGPPDITYVSCDPATLSRDLRALVDSGYKVQQLHLIDLFPQTFHLETVAMLSRA